MSAKKIGNLGRSECPICCESWSGNKHISIIQCGHSFHSECLEGIRKCPSCNSDIQSKARNYNLEELANDDLQMSPSLEFILLDISSSMRWSDSFPFFVGTSRLEVAKKFLEVIFRDRSKSKTDKLGFYSFDQNKLNLVDYKTGRKKEYLMKLGELAPLGKETNLFSSLLESLEELKGVPIQARERRLIVITDGKDTFSNKSAKEKLKKTVESFSEKKLHLKSFFVHVGDPDAGLRENCEDVNMKYMSIDLNNAEAVANSYINIHPRTETLLNNCVKEMDEESIELPDVPTHEIVCSRAPISLPA